MQQFSDCGFLRRNSTSDMMEPDADAMMKHIMNCLWAMIEYERINQKQNSEKFKLFNEAIGLMSSLAVSGFASSIVLEPSTVTLKLSEDCTWDNNEMVLLKQQGEDMQHIFINKSTDSYFWAPLYCSMITTNASEEICFEVRRLYEEYSEPVGDGLRESDVLCMEALLKSTRVSDITRLYILGVVRDRIPWLFFVKDDDWNYALHYAAHYKCSPEIMQFVLRANPEALGAQNIEDEAPFHLLLDDEYNEWTHFEQFYLFLQAADAKIIDIKAIGGTSLLGLACFQHSPRAPKTVLALLEAYPEAAAMEDFEDEFPIHFFASVEDCPDASNSNPAADLTAFESLLAANKAAAHVPYRRSGDFLLHSVARCGTLAMLKLVYEANPSAVTLCGIRGTPLHQAVSSGSVKKMEYLYSLYPEAAKMVSGNGSTLLHLAVGSPTDIEAVKLAYSYNPGAIQHGSFDGQLPLHEFVLHHKIVVKTALPYGSENVLRFLLRCYPQAVIVPDNAGETPYDLLPPNCNNLAKRLMLRAAPKLDESEIHRLNYEARRGALYLLFSAELPESAEVEAMKPKGQVSAETTTSATMIGPRRSERLTRKDMRVAQSPAIIIGEHGQQPSLPPSQQEQVAACSKIFRLLKTRGDKVLLKEIILYL
jgi:hypothetical protein